MLVTVYQQTTAIDLIILISSLCKNWVDFSCALFEYGSSVYRNNPLMVVGTAVVVGWYEACVDNGRYCDCVCEAADDDDDDDDDDVWSWSEIDK